ncbi:hypothetical protein Acr_10g0005600 [Actinidia rufa]|uniref:Uncharacterized protein n=1 Tax=Actinidia rufa TaxID=165716 RepID=A0A7J0F917_9ERIC|nr:hypothetical protein Acr_10g0005600 [Actinidia rufa]
MLSLIKLSVAAATGKVTDNPADQLVTTLNANRTAHKEPALFDNPGLACIALQYIKAYQGSCDEVGGPDAKKPPDSDFAETPLGSILRNLDDEEQELGNTLQQKSYPSGGGGVSGSDGGSPYFWCILFSGGKTNTSFVLEGGVAKVSRPGCFSGANDDCNGAHDWSRTPPTWTLAVGALIALVYAVGL